MPEHLRAWWTPDLWCLHSADWWRRHWERTGFVDVEVADTMPDGWRRWLDWHRVVAPDNAAEIQAVEADRGRYLGYVRSVGRRRPDAPVPELIASVPVEDKKTPILAEETTALGGVRDEPLPRRSGEGPQANRAIPSRPCSCWCPGSPLAGAVSTLIGTGSAGYSDQQVNNPYGLAIGPDGALYFCDLDNQRIRRLDLQTRRTTTVAGNGQQGYAGDGGAGRRRGAEHAARDPVRRRRHISTSPSATTTSSARSTRRPGIISTLAGTGAAGFSGDGGPARAGAAASAAQHRRRPGGAGC